MMISEVKIKYRGEIIVQETNVFPEYFIREKKKIDLDTCIINLSEYDHEELYHINKHLTSSMINICFMPHLVSNPANFKLLWESDEARKDRVLSLILDR